MAQLEKIYHSLIYIVISQPLNNAAVSTEEVDIPSSKELIMRADEQKKSVAAYLDEHYLKRLRPQSANNLCLLQYVHSMIAAFEPYLVAKHLLSPLERNELSTLLEGLLSTFKQLFQLTEDQVYLLDETCNLAGLKKRVSDPNKIELNPMGECIFAAIESIKADVALLQNVSLEACDSIIREYEVKKILPSEIALTVESLLKFVFEQQRKIQDLEARLRTKSSTDSLDDDKEKTPRRYRFHALLKTPELQAESEAKPRTQPEPLSQPDAQVSVLRWQRAHSSDSSDEEQLPHRRQGQCSMC